MGNFLEGLNLAAGAAGKARSVLRKRSQAALPRPVGNALWPHGVRLRLVIHLRIRHA